MARQLAGRLADSYIICRTSWRLAKFQY